jgi:hypothetical protein
MKNERKWARAIVVNCAGVPPAATFTRSMNERKERKRFCVKLEAENNLIQYERIKHEITEPGVLPREL